MKTRTWLAAVSVAFVTLFANVRSLSEARPFSAPLAVPSSNKCVDDGCKAKAYEVGNYEGDANNCGIADVTVQIGLFEDNDDGACNCDDGDCKSVIGSTCRAHATLTVTVNTSSGTFKFCPKTGAWLPPAGNTITVSLDTGIVTCASAGHVKKEALVYIVCGDPDCEDIIDASDAAWAVEVAVACWGCPNWNQDC